MKKRNARLGKAILCSFLAVILAILPLTSCEARIRSAELSKGYIRLSTESGKNDSDFEQAMMDFSLSLFRQTVKEDGENGLISPLSAILALAMLANGADGETKSQMEAAFGGIDVDSLNRSLYHYFTSHVRYEDSLHSAGSIWLRDDADRLTVEPSFLQANADWYGAQAYASEFDDSTVKDINRWCKKYTDGQIEKIIDEIDDDMVMILLNALTFDAEWKEKYEKEDVSDGVFHNGNGTRSDVQMLSSVEPRWLENEDATGFVKQYKSSRYAFVGLLPKEEGDLSAFVASLDGKVWSELWKNRISNMNVHTKMPEFSYGAEAVLNDALKVMGAEDMFDGTKADFSRLGKSSVGPIYCSLVYQKTFIEVNRNGTKASAATRIDMYDEGIVIDPPTPEEKYITLDRPFVYAIVDGQTGIPIFIGTVTNLSK